MAVCRKWLKLFLGPGAVQRCATHVQALFVAVDLPSCNLSIAIEHGHLQCG